jgi:hypothetical protein
MNEVIKIGQVVEHYKGSKYRITGVAFNEADLQMGYYIH